MAIEVPKAAAEPVISTRIPTNSARKISKFSIENTVNSLEKKVETATPVKENLPEDHFTDTDVKAEWKLFLENIKNTHEVIFLAIQNFKIEKGDEHSITITYPSVSAKSEFEKVQPEFFNHIKRKFNNYSIMPKFVQDTQNMKKEQVTPRRIFEKLVEVNPVLGELHELLKFDI